MIAGLLFANREADGTGGLLATQPFAGATLIEHQARQLATLGATQIVVIAAQPTPALMGALGRIGRRLTVDRAGGADEAAAAFHPLASVVVIGDGVVAGHALIDPLGGEGGERLVVVNDDAGGFERLGGGLGWAGTARVPAERIEEVAALPRDYDPQSTLVRASAQAGAAIVRAGGGAGAILPPGAPSGDQAGRVIVDRLAARPGWFARGVVRPAATLALRALAGRAAPAAAVVAAVIATGFAGIAAIALGWPRPGLVLALIAAIAAPIGAALLDFRGEERAREATVIAGWLIPALAVLALGIVVPAVATALALTGFAILGERAWSAEPWWGGEPGGYLLLVTLAVLAGMPVLGLAVAAIYAFATVAWRIESLRDHA